MQHMTKLPPEMDKRLSENTDKWIKIGLSTYTQPYPDQETIKRHMDDAYKYVDLEPPYMYLWFESPLSGFLASLIMSETHRSVNQLLSHADSVIKLKQWHRSSGVSKLRCDYKPLLVEIGQFKHNNIKDSPRLSEDILSALQYYIDRGIKEHICHKILIEVMGDSGETRFRQVLSQVKEQSGMQAATDIFDRCWARIANPRYRTRQISNLANFGQHDTFLAHYDYFSKYVPACERARPLMNLANEIGWYWPFDKSCVITAKPVLLHRNDRGQLHCENDMAIKYADGWGFFMLNGVLMSAEHVLIPASDMKPEIILKESNIDRRRELLRKVGMERMISCGEVIEENETYKLIDMKRLFPEVGYAPYLLMKNPSLVNAYHLEGVSPVCQTIRQAINWRAGNIKVDWTPEMLS